MTITKNNPGELKVTNLPILICTPVQQYVLHAVIFMLSHDLQPNIKLTVESNYVPDIKDKEECTMIMDNNIQL